MQEGQEQDTVSCPWLTATTFQKSSTDGIYRRCDSSGNFGHGQKRVSRWKSFDKAPPREFHAAIRFLRSLFAAWPLRLLKLPLADRREPSPASAHPPRRLGQRSSDAAPYDAAPLFTVGLAAVSHCVVQILGLPPFKQANRGGRCRPFALQRFAVCAAFHRDFPRLRGGFGGVRACAPVLAVPLDLSLPLPCPLFPSTFCLCGIMSLHSLTN